MSLTLEQKQAVVAEVAAVAAAAPAVIAAEYSGLNVAEMTALRRSARDAGIYLKVVRNTLARRGPGGNAIRLHAGVRLPVRCSLPFPMKSRGPPQRLYVTSPKKIKSWSSGLSPWMAACLIQRTLNALRVCLPWIRRVPCYWACYRPR